MHSSNDQIVITGYSTYDKRVISGELVGSVLECEDFFIVEDCNGEKYSLPFGEMSLFSTLFVIPNRIVSEEMRIFAERCRRVKLLFYDKTFQQLVENGFTCDYTDMKFVECLKNKYQTFFSVASQRALSSGIYVELYDDGVAGACLFIGNDAIPIYVIKKVEASNIFILGTSGQPTFVLHLGENVLDASFLSNDNKFLGRKFAPVLTVYSECTEPLVVAWYPTLLYPGEYVFSAARFLQSSKHS